MMRIIALLIACTALISCGADGEPVQPTVGLGVNVSNSGVSAGANVGVTTGPFTLNLGIF